MHRILSHATECTRIWARSLAIAAALCSLLCAEAESQTPEDSFLSKETFVELPDLGSIGEITFGELHASPGPELGFAGEGVLILGQGRALVRVKYPGQRIRFVDVDADGQAELFDAAMTWAASRGTIRPFRLLDQSGDERWSYDAAYWDPQYGSYPSNFMLSADASLGDLDADGTTDFVIWGPSPVELQRIDGSGTMVWRVREERSDPSDNLQLLDIDGQPGDEIVHSRGKKKIQARDAEGKVINNIDLPSAGATWTMVRWEPAGSRPSLLVSSAEGKTTAVHDLDGQKVMDLETSGPSAPIEYLATSVIFASGGGPNLAVASRLEDGCRLHVYTPEGDLVFKDSLDECSALAAIPSGPGVERLMLADGGGTIWSYRATQP